MIAQTKKFTYIRAVFRHLFMKYSLLKIFIIVMLFGLFSCKDKKKDFVFEKFKTEIEKQGMKIDSVDKPGFIYISKGELTIKISLENVRRDYDRDSDTTHITSLVNSISSYSEELPDWSKAKSNIYISLFQNDFDFQNFLHTKITDEFSKVYIHRDSMKNSWVSDNDLKKWNITEAELEIQALQNAKLLLEKTQLEFDTIENKKLGFFKTNDETLKGALLFAPNLKEKVFKDFHFPIYAVIPVRDFCYIFSEKDYSFFAKRLGNTVVKEYKESGYPITTEILKFTDKGVEVVGKYPVK
jgi:hypothetical protein